MKQPKFETKSEQIAWLVANKGELIEMKRATLKFTDLVETPQTTEANKALFTDYKDDPTSGVIKRSIVANTYNWMDSHDDVHVGNTFLKSINERANKVFHLHDHKHEVTAKVGKPLEIKEVEVDWMDLGVNRLGKTTILMLDSEIKEAYNKDVFRQYLDDEIDQHSVGMRYVKISLAVNDPEYKVEKAVWDEHYPKLGNPERAEKAGYFWAVKEASLVEVSAVLMGSNELTPTVQNIEPSEDTQKKEPEKSTQINWEEVIKNF
jgi:hypothetical protein